LPSGHGTAKLLPRKPPAVKERPGDRRSEFGYIEIRAQLAARLRPRRDRAEPRHHASMSARLKLGDLLVALSGVDNRGHRGRPPACLQAFEHGLNFVANLFGGTGLWMSMTTESWRQ